MSRLTLFEVVEAAEFHFSAKAHVPKSAKLASLANEVCEQLNGHVVDCAQSFFPINGIARRHAAMMSATMPKAAINKNCNLKFWKNEIGLINNEVKSQRD